MLAPRELGVCLAQVLAGRGWSGCAGASGTPASGLEGQRVAKGWEQRQADRVLKGQEHANLVTPWVYTARLEQ